MLLSGTKLQLHTCLGTHKPACPRNALARTITCGANGAGRQTTIHRLIEEKGALMVPGVHDALSAKALEAAGHSAAFVSGYAVSVNRDRFCSSVNTNGRACPSAYARWSKHPSFQLPQGLHSSSLTHYRFQHLYLGSLT